jgi:hypothetical protein
MTSTPIARQPNRPDGARVVITARVDAEVAAEIERIAAENGHTVSYTAARLLRTGLTAETAA